METEGNLYFGSKLLYSSAIERGAFPGRISCQPVWESRRWANQIVGWCSLPHPSLLPSSVVCVQGS